MVLSSVQISSAIKGQFIVVGFSGRECGKIADAIGNSLYLYLVTPNIVSCTLSGVSGVTGFISSVSVLGLVPTSMSSFMYTKAALKRYTGRDIRKFFDAISTGICQSLLGMMLTGTAVGISTGTGIGSFVNVNEVMLTNILYDNMVLRKILGRDSRGLCECISYGIVNQLRTAVKFSVITNGVVTPVPPVGPVTVFGIPSIYTQIS